MRARRPEGPARKLFIISGISGAGKSQALKCFEDFGFFCIDNLPIALLPDFVEILQRSDRHEKVALGMDVRERGFIKGFSRSLKYLRDRGITTRVIFLDASDAALVQRYSETRHRHPLGKKIGDAIREERRMLLEVKALADKVVDTSTMTLGELKETLSKALELKAAREMNLSVVSFGYKYGVPMDADIVMDVRFLPNPNYVAGLRRKTGLSPEVRRYLGRQPAALRFARRYLDLIRDLLPGYVREGKSYLTVAIGCTGGRHRSVFLANYLARGLRDLGHRVQEFHRDITK